MGGVLLVVLAFFLLCRRRKQRDGESTKAHQHIDPFPSSSGNSFNTNGVLAESSTQSRRRPLDHQQSSSSQIGDPSGYRGMNQPNLNAGPYTIGGSRKAKQEAPPAYSA